MAAETPVSLSQPCVPVFKGEDYGRWRLRMKTVFRSQELWELVEKGVPEGEEEAKARETKKKDAKALCLIQQAIDGPILDRIEEAETAHDAWEIVKNVYQGTSKMMTVKALGHKLTEAEVVSKVLRSLAPKFDFVAVAMEESRDMSTLTLDELGGSLQAHEVRVNRSLTKKVEKALVVKTESSASNVKEKGNPSAITGWSPTRGRGRGFIRGRGRGRSSRGWSGDNKSNI
ncbi:uncharacterized protein LOC120259967 [Dioscorea cayenensis subsp. rotundata]|uniref:Uncharacterized protein LOC120259967 n=1 Tax=Dioscorea cayennensis subsp. rotundata TaxID=55577 RepID=A0AB40B7W0_DIOCR|nr:uncharacterized protein LOC120259967 [Dioscorea cayenensis subsp. rotundata]